MEELSVPPAATVAADPESYPRYRWVIIVQLWLHGPLTFMAGTALGITLPDMRSQLGFGPLEAGWLGAASTLGMLAMLPASALLVHFNPRWAYGLFLALIGLGICGVGLGPNFPLIFAGFVAYSLAASLAFVPATFLRIQWVPLTQFATIMGIGFAIAATGQSFAFAAIPQLLRLTGNWRMVYLVLGIMMLVAAGVWMGWGRERVTPRYREEMAQNRGLTAFKEAMRRKEFFLLGLSILGGATAYVTTVLFLPTYLVEERGLPLSTAGLMTGLMPLGGLFGTLLIGYVADRLGRRKLTIWPFGLALPALYWTLLSPLPPAALAGVAFLLGFAAWAPFPALQTMPYELPGVKPSEVAVGQSIMQTVSTLGFLAGPVIAGAVAQASGSVRVGLLSLSFLPLLMALVPLALPETGPAAAKGEAAPASA